MRKIQNAPVLLFAMLMALCAVCSCNDGETYADKKKTEKNAINKFITDNNVVGPIKVITESQFLAQDSTTNLAENEYVLFEEDGIYMQIMERGNGQSFAEMSKDFADSTVNKNVLCRFCEYDIISGDTALYNYDVPLWVDKMLVSYSRRSRSYTASFTSGMMASSSQGSVVPTGWLKPLDYVRMSRSIEDVARVRLIIPHSSGTAAASMNVYPYFYDITFQLGK